MTSCSRASSSRKCTTRAARQQMLPAAHLCLQPEPGRCCSCNLRRREMDPPLQVLRSTLNLCAPFHRRSAVNLRFHIFVQARCCRV